MSSSTPILDRLVPVPAAGRYWTAGPVNVLAALVAGGGLLPVIVGNFFWMRAHPLYTVLEIVAAYYGGCLLHECGHVLAAILLGNTVQLFEVGPISLVRAGGRRRLCFDQKKWAPSGAVCSFSSGGKLARWKLFLMVGGGPLVNLLVLLWLVEGWRWWLRVLPAWYVPAIYVTVLMLCNALGPQEAPISDGQRLLQLLSKQEGPPYCALMELLGRTMRSEPMANWEPELVARAAETAEFPNDRCLANLLASRWAFARGDVQSAATHLEVSLAFCALMPAALRTEIFRWASMVQMRRQNLPSSRAWFVLAKDPAAERAGAPATLLSLHDRA